jgi:membrane associated rhomboid family serine protease
VRRIFGERPPVVTAAALVLALVAAAVQFMAPSVMARLERDRGALAEGEWWRVVTPVMVQTLGWHQVFANLLTLLAVGVVAERLVGRWRWVVLFAVGTAAGQAAAYLWGEPGGGASIAICGLAGGTLVVLLALGDRAPRLSTWVILCYVVALAGWGSGGFLGAGLGSVAAVALGYEVDRLGFPWSDRLALVGALLLVAALVVVRDIHGVPLAAGAVAGAAWLVWGRLSTRVCPTRQGA